MQTQPLDIHSRINIISRLISSARGGAFIVRALLRNEPVPDGFTVDDGVTIDNCLDVIKDAMNETEIYLTEIASAVSVIETERDDAKEQLQKIGRKAFWAAKSSTP